jgi:hypothetical protein
MSGGICEYNVAGQLDGLVPPRTEGRHFPLAYLQDAMDGSRRTS